MLSDPAPKAKKRGKKNPAPLNNGMYKPFIVATTMSSAQEKRGGCCARSGGPVSMTTALE